MSEIALALFQPDIAPNVGATIRLAACLGAPLHVIEPCGFAFSLHAVRRQAMDYAKTAEIHHHDSWPRFQEATEGRRLIALTTRGAQRIWDTAFRPGDVLILGRESAGLPEPVHRAAALRIAIPLAEGMRSLNVTHAAAIALGEAQRQTGTGPA